MSESSEGRGKALAGIKVLEYCELVAGPYCGKLLADLGAEVIKIEEPGRGDEARQRGPFLHDIPHAERSGLYFYTNTNKLGITLNLKIPSGREIFRRLVQDADIFLEDKPLGAMKILGIDYESLEQINPGLVVTSITPFGQTGPYKDYKAYHLNIFHAGGEGYLLPGKNSSIGFSGREPLKSAGFVGDYDSGVAAATATLAALFGRALSGSGQFVDVSRQQVELSLNRDPLAKYSQDRIVPHRYDMAYEAGGIMPCQNGYVVFRPSSDAHWRALVEFLGAPDLAEDERFKDRDGRTKNGEELNRVIAPLLMKYTKDELHHGAGSNGSLIGAYLTAEEAINSEQMKAREFFVETDHPELGKVKFPSASYRFSKTPWALDRPAPLLGQHNEEIYCQRLGYSKEQLTQMRRTGVI